MRKMNDLIKRARSAKVCKSSLEIVCGQFFVKKYNLRKNTPFLWSGPCNPCLLSEETDADLWEGWWANLSTILISISSTGKKKELLRGLEKVFEYLSIEFRIPLTDFPDVNETRTKLAKYFGHFPP